MGSIGGWLKSLFRKGSQQEKQALSKSVDVKASAGSTPAPSAQDDGTYRHLGLLFEVDESEPLEIAYKDFPRPWTHLYFETWDDLDRVMLQPVSPGLLYPNPTMVPSEWFFIADTACIQGCGKGGPEDEDEADIVK